MLGFIEEDVVVDVIELTDGVLDGVLGDVMCSTMYVCCGHVISTFVMCEFPLVDATPRDQTDLLVLLHLVADGQGESSVRLFLKEEG